MFKSNLRGSQEKINTAEKVNTTNIEKMVFDYSKICISIPKTPEIKNLRSEREVDKTLDDVKFQCNNIVVDLNYLKQQIDQYSDPNEKLALLKDYNSGIEARRETLNILIDSLNNFRLNPVLFATDYQYLLQITFASLLLLLILLAKQHKLK